VFPTVMSCRWSRCCVRSRLVARHRLVVRSQGFGSFVRGVWCREGEGSCAFGASADPFPKAAPASPAQLSTLPQGEGWAFVAALKKRGVAGIASKRDAGNPGGSKLEGAKAAESFGAGSAKAPKAPEPQPAAGNLIAAPMSHVSWYRSTSGFQPAPIGHRARR
jgi:hypothetical protein